MHRLYTTLIALIATISMMAQGWPANYGGVMLQGFSWDSFVDTQWTNLESQADELSSYFDLIWVPQSGNCNSSYNQMGYTPVYYFDQNSSFGTEAQLRKMIQTFKAKNTGIIADVVINHRNNLGVNGSWVDYPAETYQGVTYQMLSTDICGNDDNGKTKTWANQNGYKLGNDENHSTCEDWDGCRDLDHSSENVQKIIKVYLKFLLNDLGYAGFRYDMTKGFLRSYLAEYNYDAKPQFSVGEYWDGNKTTLKNVINQQKKNNGSCKNQGMKKQGNCSKPGKGKPSPKSMKQMQQELNKQMEALKKQLDKQGKNQQDGRKKIGDKSTMMMSEEFARMAAQQEMIRRMMQEYGQEMKQENAGNSKLLKEIDQLMKQMEETETDLVNRVISQQTINRQHQIMSRLLEHEKAEMQREKEERRESREGKDIPHQPSQSDLEKFKRLQNNNSDLFRSVPPTLSPYYKAKVSEYFYQF